MWENYGQKAFFNYSLFSILYLVLLIIFFWGSSKAFPWIYKKIEIFISTKIKDISIKDKEIVKSSTIAKILLLIVKGIRFGLVFWISWKWIFSWFKLRIS